MDKRRSSVILVRVVLDGREDRLQGLSRGVSQDSGSRQFNGRTEIR